MHNGQERRLQALFIPHLVPALSREAPAEQGLEEALGEVVARLAAAQIPGRPGEAEFLVHLASRLPEGADLVALVRRVHVEDLALAQALAAAHGSGVVHGDLKPANVILARDGRARVVDFGLARAVSTGETTERDGRPAAGTPAYMAPEQWAGCSLNPAADVWALGVVLFELLHGRRPFKAGSLVGLRRLVASPETELPPAHEAEGVLGELLEGCLQRDPGQRPNAAQVQARLEGLLQPEGAGAALESEQGGPFRGLLPFSEEHAAAFVGREAEVAAFMELMRDHGVLTVVGPSGAGKTSFVQAGVLPRLREQADWMVLRLRPGAEPFKTLAARLARAQGGPGTPEGEDGGESELAETLGQAPTRLNLLLRRLAESSGRRLLLGAVVGVAFSPDGAYLASASRDESLRMWCVAAAGLEPASAGHTASVWSVAFSPDGKLLASGSRDGSVRLWAAADGQQRKVLAGHPDGVLALSFSPDGKLLASAGADHKVRLWEPRTGRSRRLLSGHSVATTAPSACGMWPAASPRGGPGPARARQRPRPLPLASRMRPCAAPRPHRWWPGPRPPWTPWPSCAWDGVLLQSKNSATVELGSK